MKVFINRMIPQKGLDILRNNGVEIEVWEKKESIPYEELIRRCKNCDALISVMSPYIIDENFFKECPTIKVVSLYSVGYDSVDIEAANKYKIPVGNTPDVLSGATADVAFMLLLATSRKAFYWHKLILEGKWGAFDPNQNLGIELNNKVLGIFGLGSIGYEMAKKCRGAYNMNIIYHNRKPNEKAEKELNARYVSFEELLTQSDVISVHSILSNETKGLFNKEVFSKMKNNCIFINVARGGIHNEQDLLEVLNKGGIWGAGLDVTNPEPMSKDNPLLNMPNVSITPHIGSATKETRDAMAEICANNILAGLKGEKLPHIVNMSIYNN